MGMSRALASALAAAMTLPACGASDPSAAPACVDGVLAAYRGLADHEQASRAYGRAARDAAGLARDCAEEAVGSGCRDAMEDMTALLGDAGGAPFDKGRGAIEAHRARLEGAAAAAAACGSSS